MDVLEKFYQATKDALIEAKNEVPLNRICVSGDADLVHRGFLSRRI